MTQCPVLCSMAGHRLPSKEVTFYSATKHAVTALTEGLRRELVEAKSHIRVSVKQQRNSTNSTVTCFVFYLIRLFLRS